MDLHRRFRIARRPRRRNRRKVASTSGVATSTTVSEHAVFTRDGKLIAAALERDQQR
jgi:hypothetical protein